MAGAFSPGNIGLIGAGLMGTAFAERLLAAGFHVIAWDRDVSRVAPLSALGAETAASAVMVGARCARSILSLPNSDIVAAALAESLVLADAMGLDPKRGDYPRVGAICALIYAFGIIAIWWAPDTAGKTLDN